MVDATVLTHPIALAGAGSQPGDVRGPDVPCLRTERDRTGHEIDVPCDLPVAARTS